MQTKKVTRWTNRAPAFSLSAAAIMAVATISAPPLALNVSAQETGNVAALCGQVSSDRQRLECYDLVAACRIMMDGRERLTCYDRMNNPAVPQADLYSGSDLSAADPDQTMLPPAVQQAPFLRTAMPNVSSGPAGSPGQNQVQGQPSQSVSEFGRSHGLFGGVTASGALRAVIVEVRQDVRSRQLYFEFENGQVWKQTDAKRVDPIPDKGALATITPSSFGSYILTVEGRRFAVKIRRIS